MRLSAICYRLSAVCCPLLPSAVHSTLFGRIGYFYPCKLSEHMIEHLVRENILRLTPYSSARSEFKGAARIFIDANENPYDTGLNRYPDPLQWALKARIAAEGSGFSRSRRM